LAISTLTDYICGKKIYENPKVELRKLYLGISICTNLSILGFFKYYNFFINSFYDLLISIGVKTENTWLLDIILPMGISFYTFQTMAYTIDIYRNNTKPTNNLLSFALYVTYFPQLVAGPIERAKRLLPQLEKPRSYCPKTVSSGIALIITGFFKKVVIGDYLSAPYANLAFTETISCSPEALMLGICMFSIQIYADFSGYSDIARGISRMLGIELMVNFRQPYLSRNITEFWKRWHISLSEWLRDYLYIPLGGNRNSNFKTHRNLLITMILGGLWHGANWTFVIWGALHGFYLIFHKLILGKTKSDFSNMVTFNIFLKNTGKIFLMNILVLLTWIFFRANNLEHSIDYIKNLTIGLLNLSILIKLMVILIMYLGFIFGIDYLFYKTDSDEILSKSNFIIRIPVYTVLILSVWIAWPSEYSPFIYFQF